MKRCVSGKGTRDDFTESDFVTWTPTWHTQVRKILFYVYRLVPNSNLNINFILIKKLNYKDKYIYIYTKIHHHRLYEFIHCTGSATAFSTGSGTTTRHHVDSEWLSEATTGSGCGATSVGLIHTDSAVPIRSVTSQPPPARLLRHATISPPRFITATSQICKQNKKPVRNCIIRWRERKNTKRNERRKIKKSSDEGRANKRKTKRKPEKIQSLKLTMRKH